jgi:hypothetical protein
VAALTFNSFQPQKVDRLLAGAGSIFTFNH